MKRILLYLLLTIVVLYTFGLSLDVVSADSYSFSVPEASTEFYINTDGTATIRYTYLFVNDANAPAIEYVDVGLPTFDFNLTNIQATLDGTVISNITYADPTYIFESQGVTVSLGSKSIPAGESGTFVLTVFNIGGILYQADEPEGYASFLFMPNYFGSEYVNGKTSYEMVLLMPPGLESTEPIYFPAERWPGSDEPDEIGYTTTGRVYYRWVSDKADLHSQYYFGGAFPASYVPAATIQLPPSASERFWAGVENFFENFLPICCVAGFIGGPIGLGILQGRAQKKRKLKYLPPKIKIEGHGIKRGLTAVQAAVLLEKPMDQIVTMILFSVVRKGAAEVIEKDPLKIRVLESADDNLYPYEQSFLDAMKEEKKSKQRSELQEMMLKLINSVHEKMKGFSYKETVTYYEDIVSRAWTQVESAETPEVAMEAYDKYMGWTMLDDEFEDRTKNVFVGPRPIIMPMWWHRYDPVYRAGTSSSLGNAPSGGGGMKIGGQQSMPSLPGADFAAGVVLGAQNFAQNTIGDLTSFTEKITNKTNPLPKPSSSSSYSGRSGGSSCACACACAGCACACAGGGR
ncbi:MAG: hypothetical protein V2J07_12370 [Anaerolineae bacterium]|jgi:hypothetical protein|nr:hypothetical protein [Anaerolineae bacterium]